MSDSPQPERVHRYEGQNLVVLYDKKRCIHAAACVRGLPEVFDTHARPWVQPDGATREAVLATIHRCPSGALSAETTDGQSLEPEGSTMPNTIEVRPDGPLHLRGHLTVVRPDGAVMVTATRLALCRCGASKNKPFCDLSHVEAGFTDPGPEALVALRNEPEAVADSGLKITVRPNGSLAVDGRFELLSANGAGCGEGTKTSLCRCGHSARKPLCDGSHNRVGFVAE